MKNEMEIKLLSIAVDNEQIAALKQLLDSELTREEKNNLLLKALPFVISLHTKYEIADSIDAYINSINPAQTLEAEVEYLKAVNEKQKWQISGLMMKTFLSQDLARFAGIKLSATVADIILNPDPVSIHATELGKGLDFLVSINNILAIKSIKREKIIFLKEPQRPKQNARYYSLIRTNDNKLSFENLLWSIQKNGKHLFRINTSFAINIYKYTLTEQNQFHLTEEPNPKKADERFFKEIFDLEVDNHFKRDDYDLRLYEMDYLFNYREKFGVSDEKMKEIDRYIKTLEITK